MTLTQPPMDHYAVIGNPIAHSKSPAIHAAFARETAQDIDYVTLLSPLDSFPETVATFRDAGGRGANVTVPFKLEAFALASRQSPRALAAGAVNTLVFDDEGIFGDNTDGAGLVRDLTHNLGIVLEDARILLLGAGGAARGVILPLLGEAPASLTIANRSPDKAHTLAKDFADGAKQKGALLDAVSFENLADVHREGFDVVINATASSLANTAPAIPASSYRACKLAYDMMYGKNETPFLAAARAGGALAGADGLGMLVEQAAESFCLWRGVRPDTRRVRDEMRVQLASE